MAAAFKTSKSDLVAIHRLEFYKKQKNWKFCTTERKKEEERRKAAKNAKAKLNQTYSIDPAPERDRNTANTQTEEVKLETEEVPRGVERQKEAEPVAAEERGDNLNEAFVDTETDENVTTQPDSAPTGPYSPKWSIQQWAARCRQWTNTPTPTIPTSPQCVQNAPTHHALSDPSQPYYAPIDPSQPYYVPSDPSQQYYVTSDPKQPYHVASNPAQPYSVEKSMILGQAINDYEAELIYNRKEMPHAGTNWPQEANMLNADGLRDWERLEDYVGAGWPRHSQVWTNRHEGWFEEICDIPEEAIEAMEALGVGDGDADAVDGGAPRAQLARPGDWLRSSFDFDKGALPRSDSLPSVSSGSFTCGAALAPHSTELDVSAGVLSTGVLSAGALSAGALSAPALAAAVAEHAAALHKLLGEARRRDLQVSPPPVDQIYSFDEYPTRDMGFAPHTHEPPRPPYAHTPTPSSVYTHNPTVVNDVFVAGSYNNNNRPDLSGQTEGRGRGRKVRVIGIEMGRPFRL